MEMVFGEFMEFAIVVDDERSVQNWIGSGFHGSRGKFL